MYIPKVTQLSSEATLTGFSNAGICCNNYYSWWPLKL